ncbi:hypothetical protein [Bacillus sp. B-jedd]|uniref:hypothetical protein n=1 Tax=Bacillus sp. B-jedd TaxID=1476857 RepID=UPI0005155D5F|nr:hypothetical protein [Bacillus sp. B-jedd]CEG25790.1 hypothetical protein BN1002_00607 [Bacillus sp. B-jedd]
MEENKNTEEPKKISLQEAMKQQLANKKNQAAAGAKGKGAGDTSTKKMKSQLTKKPSNTRRKMGT